MTKKNDEKPIKLEYLNIQGTLDDVLKASVPKKKTDNKDKSTKTNKDS
ncbi:hypothetical protein [Psychroserpens sp.]